MKKPWSFFTLLSLLVTAQLCVRFNFPNSIYVSGEGGSAREGVSERESRRAGCESECTTERGAVRRRGRCEHDPLLAVEGAGVRLDAWRLRDQSDPLYADFREL